MFHLVGNISKGTYLRCTEPRKLNFAISVRTGGGKKRGGAMPELKAVPRLVFAAKIP